MKKIIVIMTVVLIYITVIATSTLTLFVPFAQAKQKNRRKYLLRPNDVLDIQVQNHKNSNGSFASDSGKMQFVVRDDGTLSFPMVGELVVEGKTVLQLTDTIEQKLKKYFVEPMVTINIVQSGTTRVFVLGEVKSQGMFELKKGHNVLDALGAAGGLTRESEVRWVLLIRADTLEDIREVGQTAEGANILERGVTKINFQRFISQGDLSQNVVLNEGDCLFVTRNHRIDWLKMLSTVLADIHDISRLRRDWRDW